MVCVCVCVCAMGGCYIEGSESRDSAEDEVTEEAEAAAEQKKKKKVCVCVCVCRIAGSLVATHFLGSFGPR